MGEDLKKEKKKKFNVLSIVLDAIDKLKFNNKLQIAYTSSRA